MLRFYNVENRHVLKEKKKRNRIYYYSFVIKPQQCQILRSDWSEGVRQITVCIEVTSHQYGDLLDALYWGRQMEKQDICLYGKQRNTFGP